MALPLPAPGSIGQPIQRPPLHARLWKPLLHGLPVFGSCYGMQLGVAVLGGRLYANPSGLEIAIARDIRLSDAGKPIRYMMASRKSLMLYVCTAMMCWIVAAAFNLSLPMPIAGSGGCQQGGRYSVLGRAISSRAEFFANCRLSGTLGC